jgi:hypothetical protein
MSEILRFPSFHTEYKYLMMVWSNNSNKKAQEYCYLLREIYVLNNFLTIAQG